MTLLVALLLITWPLYSVKAQPFTTGQIETGTGCDGTFSSMAENPVDKKIYGFWRKGSGTAATYKLIRFEGSSWTTVGSFSAASIGFFNSAYDGISLAIDTNGQFHVAFNGENSTGTCCNSERGGGYGTSANGSSWTFTKIQTFSHPNGFKGTDNPILELDGANRPHIVFRFSDVTSPQTYTLRYYQYNGSSWVGADAFSQSGGSPAPNQITQFDFALDGTGKAHIAFQRETAGQGRDGGLWYVTNATGSWGTPIVLAAGLQDQEQGESIDIDAADKVNIVHSNYQGNLYFLTNACGSFTSSQINGNLTGSVRSYNFRINSNGDRFLLNGGSQYAYLLAGTSGNWTTGTAYTPTAGVEVGTYPSGLLARDGRIMLLYDYKANGDCSEQNPRNLYYSTAVIPTPALVTSVTAPSSGPTNAASIDYTVSFNKPVNGGYGNTYSLITTGTLAGVRIIQTAVLATARILTVTTGTGSSTLRVDVTDGSTYSPSVSNLPFTTGTTVTIDKIAPGINAVGVPVTGTYRAGQNLNFTVNYNEAVTVTGTPTLPLTIGGTSVQATYLSGSGSGSLTFRYTVMAGQQDTDGVTVGSAVGLNGGTLQDEAGNDANLTLSGVANTTGVRVDALAPAVSISSTAGPSGSNTGSSPIPFTLTFTKSVTGITANDIALTNATLVGLSGSGTSYSFNVTPTTNGLVTINLAANVAQDAAGNGNTVAPTFSITYTQPVTNAPLVNSPANGATTNATPSYIGTAPASSTVTVYVDATPLARPSLEQGIGI